MQHPLNFCHWHPLNFNWTSFALSPLSFTITLQQYKKKVKLHGSSIKVPWREVSLIKVQKTSHNNAKSLCSTSAHVRPYYVYVRPLICLYIYIYRSLYAAGVRGLGEEEETCFMVVMPAHIDAVLGKLLAVGGGGDSPSSTGTSRLLRTQLFRPQLVSGFGGGWLVGRACWYV